MPCRLPEALAVAITTISLSAAASAQPIRWRSVEGAPRPPVTSVQAARALGELIGPAEVRHVVVQFAHPIDKNVRAQLSAAGVELLDYLADNAFFAAVDRDRIDVAGVGRVRSLQLAHAIERDVKLHPMLLRGEVPQWSIVRQVIGPDGREPEPVVGVYVLFHRDVPQDDAVELARRHGAEVRARLQSVNGLVIELPVSRIDALAEEDAVQWIEPPLPPLAETNSGCREAVQANDVQAPPYNLDGAGVVVMVFESGTALASHPDFGGRLTPRGGSLSSHSTHVSGTIGGAGALHGGMAPAVTLESYGFEPGAGGIHLYTDPGDIEADYSDAINSHGAVLANNSTGSNVESSGWSCEIQGNYGLTSTVIDAIVRGSLGAPISSVWAAGNERGGDRCDIEGFGDYYSIPPPAAAKNHITVGATNSNNNSITSFTSWGPCDDGRLKPDLCAPGCSNAGVISCWSNGGYAMLCGTSMAAPVVTGLSALLIEDYRNQFPAYPDFRPSTLKALLTHTALDLVNPGPDYKSGYGLVQAKAVIDFMRSGQFLEAEVDQGQVYTIPVVVAAGTDALKVTLTWDDVPGTPNVVPALVNDLDLLVTGPGGTFFPWTLDPFDHPAAPAVRTAPDHINNIEQVLVDNPLPGTWTVEVHGFNVPEGPQPFSIAGAGQLSHMVISLPDGAPETIQPDEPTSITVLITAPGEAVVAGSETCFFRFGEGSFSAEPLTPLGGDLYEAVLPPAPCGSSVEFYFSAQGSVSGEVFNPPGAPVNTYAPLIGTLVDLFADDFEGDLGWTVQNGAGLADGAWDRGVPVGGGDRGDPPTDADGSGQCFLTDNVGGNSDVDGGRTTLISPTIDLGGADATVSYWRWYSNDTGGAPNADTFLVEISNDDGASWVNVETIGPSGPGTSGGWIFHEFNVADFVAPTSQVRMRFVASDDGQPSLVEAAVDDFLVRRFACGGVATPGDVNGDGVLNILDLIDLLLCFDQPAESPCDPADLNGDGMVDVLDLIALLVEL